MLEEAGERGIEGSVAGPEAGEGKDTLAAELLDETTLGKYDTKDITKGRECYKDGESALSFGAEDVTEERGGNQALRGYDFLGRDGGEVCNVDKHVQDSDGAESQGSGEL